MKVKVRAFGHLTALLGNQTDIELEADAKLKDLVARLKERSTGLNENFLGRFERGEPELMILLNGRNIHTLEKLQTSLNDGDIVVLLPPAVGG